MINDILENSREFLDLIEPHGFGLFDVTVRDEAKTQFTIQYLLENGSESVIKIDSGYVLLPKDPDEMARFNFYANFNRYVPSLWISLWNHPGLTGKGAFEYKENYVYTFRRLLFLKDRVIAHSDTIDKQNPPPSLNIPYYRLRTIFDFGFFIIDSDEFMSKCIEPKEQSVSSIDRSYKY